MIERYVAAVVQPEVNMCQTRDDIKRNLARYLDLIDFTVGFYWEHPCKLIAFPEYFLQGVPTPGKGEKRRADFMDVAIEIPGEEMEILGEKAREYGIYIAGGGIIERIPDWPNRWFNTGVIIGPEGDVILRYHKWEIPTFLGLGTSPHDVLDEYGERFGRDLKSLFPVVDTPIGKLGVCICYDGFKPEVTRALAFNGAEVIIHSTAMPAPDGISEPNDLWTITNRVRAADNLVYLLAPNWGAVNYRYYPKHFSPGKSLIIDYHGAIIGQADYPGEGVIGAILDVEGLRERRTLSWRNFWADLRVEPYGEMYKEPIYPANRFSGGKLPETLADKMAGEVEAFERLYRWGTFTPPSREMPSIMERIRRAQARGMLKK